MGKVKVVGSRVNLVGSFGDGSLPITQETREKWGSWIRRYCKAVPISSHDLLRPIGLEIFAWLDSGGWATNWLDSGGARRLEIGADAGIADDQRLLLSLPWELLGNNQGYFAEDSVQPFEIWRRVGAEEIPPKPRHKDLSLLFMAASPRDSGPELDFEREEAAILSATEELSLSLAVEESGCVDFLATRARQQEAFDAYHFSCHGDVLDGKAASRLANKGACEGPNLILETQDGYQDFVSPEKLAKVWENDPPSLVFLSACRTSEEPQDLAEAFTARLARGVPAVVGWDGSVYDPDAIEFSEAFYSELAGFRTTPQAAARARRTLLESSRKDATKGTHWHLARLWLGPKGGEALCARDGIRRQLPKNAGFETYLDIENKRVQVAGPLSFVGRRRFTQDAIRALRKDDASGILLFGMGNLGKSSLAARVANRLSHLKSVVIYHDYDAVTVFDKLVKVLKPEDRDAVNATWRDRVREKPPVLADAVESLLTGPFYDAPILLIIDDLEQILEDPTPGQKITPLKTDFGWADTIVAVLTAFRKTREDSRLLFTSRYDFSAIDTQGVDLAGQLEKIQLTPFSVHEREKQWRAERSIRLQNKDAAMRNAVEQALADERCAGLMKTCLRIADGNPGLQEILTGPLLAGEFDPVAEAIDAIDRHLADPKFIPKESSKAFEFFRRMAFDQYKAALSPTEARYLSSVSLFGDGVWPSGIEATALAALHNYQTAPVPVPEEALEAVGGAAGISDPKSARLRLTGLGLLDTHAPLHTGKDNSEYLVNRFARPLVAPISKEERANLSKIALRPLEKKWAQGRDEWPQDNRAVEALRLALLAGVIG